MYSAQEQIGHFEGSEVQLTVDAVTWQSNNDHCFASLAKGPLWVRKGFLLCKSLQFELVVGLFKFHEDQDLIFGYPAAPKKKLC